MHIKSIRLMLVVGATIGALTSGTVAQSRPPVPAVSASSTSAAPSASPFPWPTLLPPGQVPVPAPFEPVGPADATVTLHRIRMELWLSSPAATPGEWIQALVRTTNLGTDAAWSHSGECGTSGTEVDVDLRSVVPPGQVQTGNAAVFKELVLRHDLGASFTQWRYLPHAWESPVDGLAWGSWAECTAMPVPLKLRAGRTLEERFAWYPASSLDGEVWFQPLPAGTVQVTAEWPFVGRGPRHPRTATLKPVTVTASLGLTGGGPGTPSLPELVDIALADPRFRAWVDDDPTRATWDIPDGVSATGWPGPTYQNNMLLWDLRDPPPTGILTLELDHPVSSRGVIALDPWTGEVLQVRFP